jgi:hypothetical protein
MLDARGQDAAQTRLVASRTLIGRHRTGAVVILAGALIAAACGLLLLAAALGIGACVEAVVALWLALSRRSVIARLALDPAGHQLPEVAAFAERLASAPSRRRFAGQLTRALESDPVTVAAFPYLPARLRAYARELAELGHALAAPDCRVKPTAAVECHRLLTDAANSPLFNPNLDAADLAASLYRIRAGIMLPARDAAAGAAGDGPALLNQPRPG